MDERTDNTITAERIDELLRFLPFFEQPGRELVHWVASIKRPDGTNSWPYPEYDDEIIAFMELASRPCWCDYEYTEKRVHETIEDDVAVARASLEEIKTMITWCVRGERFCDGHFGALLKNGRIIAILKRLSVLRGEM